MNVNIKRSASLSSKYPDMVQGGLCSPASELISMGQLWRLEEPQHEQH